MLAAGYDETGTAVQCRDLDLDRHHHGQLGRDRRERLVLEVALQRLAEVAQRLVDRTALTGDLDLHTASAVEVVRGGDNIAEILVVPYFLVTFAGEGSKKSATVGALST
jgi:hypothetical protein